MTTTLHEEITQLRRNLAAEKRAHSETRAKLDTLRAEAERLRHSEKGDEDWDAFDLAIEESYAL